jgi:hypothetical protein
MDGGARRADGSVLATDLDTTHLEPLAGTVLEVRRHDMLADELPAGSFDLVHARLPLSWLGSSDALQRLIASLAPRGWLRERRLRPPLRTDAPAAPRAVGA